MFAAICITNKLLSLFLDHLLYVWIILWITDCLDYWSLWNTKLCLWNADLSLRNIYLYIGNTAFLGTLISIHGTWTSVYETLICIHGTLISTHRTFWSHFYSWNIGILWFLFSMEHFDFWSLFMEHWSLFMEHWSLFMDRLPPNMSSSNILRYQYMSQTQLLK